jgi:hypothetical protein
MRAILTISFILLCSHQAFAQNEVQRELSSLAGIAEFGVVVNIEKPVSLEVENLEPGIIRKSIIENFGDLPVSILTDATLQQSDQFPILHIHVNVMQASNGTYPFAIEMNFFQPVKLILNRDLQSMASTWNKGQVGIVSEDMLQMISDEAIQASNIFKDEFIRMN